MQRDNTRELFAQNISEKISERIKAKLADAFKQHNIKIEGKIEVFVNTEFKNHPGNPKIINDAELFCVILIREF